MRACRRPMEAACLRVRKCANNRQLMLLALKGFYDTHAQLTSVSYIHAKRRVRYVYIRKHWLVYFSPQSQFENFSRDTVPLKCRQLGSGSRRENSTQNVFSLILICLVLNTINFVHDLSNIAKKKKQIFKRFLCQKFCRLVSGFTQKRPALTGSVSTTLVSTYVVHTSQLVNNTWCLSIVFDSLDCTACQWL